MPVSAENSDVPLARQVLEFCASVEELGSPDAVIDRLHATVSAHTQLSVLGAMLRPLRWGDWSSVELGRNVFLHPTVPEGWWQEYFEHNQAHPSPSYTLAQYSLAPFTLSELMHMLQPVGIDRWAYESAQRHGIRDVLVCPVGGRWIIAYWSRSVLGRRLTQDDRVLLFTAAMYTAIRMHKIVDPYRNRLTRGAALTPRELSVLRQIADGRRIKDAAEHLHLGEETVRSHLKKAQVKLDAATPAHAVAQAIRLMLIP